MEVINTAWCRGAALGPRPTGDGGKDKTRAWTRQEVSLHATYSMAMVHAIGAANLCRSHLPVEVINTGGCSTANGYKK